MEEGTGFELLSFIAAAHHERLDGKGYPESLDGNNLPLTARILCVADVYQALSEERPYRQGLPNNVVFGMMDEDAPSRLDPKCLDALKQHKEEQPQTKAALSCHRRKLVFGPKPFTCKILPIAANPWPFYGLR